MFAISAHYSSPADYSQENLTAVRNGWERIYNAVRLTRQQMTRADHRDDGSDFRKVIEQTRAEFTGMMDDDFNTPRAIAVLQDFVREVNTLLNSTTVGLPVLTAIHDTFSDLGGTVLGIIPTADAAPGERSAEREAALIEMLIAMRNRARADKDWKQSDHIRDQLAQIGVILEDRPDGTLWKAD